MNLINRHHFAYHTAANWQTCLQLWWYTLWFSVAIRWPWLYRRWWQSQQVHAYQINWETQLFTLHLRPQDLPVFYEIFQDKAYQLPGDIVIPTNASVIDIGAHVGLFSCYFRQKYSGTARILALEPSPSNFSVLQKNLAHQLNTNLLQQAVAPQEGAVFLQTDGLSYNHRLGQRNRGGVEVSASSLEKLLTAYSLQQKLFLLKMDVEGMEAQLVPLLRSHTSCIQYLLLEIHAPYTINQLIHDLTIETQQILELQKSTYLISF